MSFGAGNAASHVLWHQQKQLQSLLCISIAVAPAVAAAAAALLHPLLLLMLLLLLLLSDVIGQS